ncbi:hypothetical protein LEN26_018217, partial [Aphanomyces euteiches]
MHDEKKSKDAEKKRSKDILICNTSYDPPPPVPQICLAISDPSALPPEFALLEGERLAFWKKADINDEERSSQSFLQGAVMNNSIKILADTGANLSVIHRRLVERLKIPIDTTKTTGINGLGSNAITTFGMVKIKLTIGNGLVFIFSLAVCDIGPVDFELILGMDFLSKAGVVIDTARREMNLPDGEYVPLLTKNIEYVKTFCTYIKLRYDLNIASGESAGVWLSKYAKASDNSEYWVNRGTKWIPTVCVDEMKKP